MGVVTPFDYLPYFSSRLHRHGDGGGGRDAARVALKAIGFIPTKPQLVISVNDIRLITEKSYYVKNTEQPD
ncbi:hypothetical protein GUJ93_ZPchr0012g21296 [Zizania palustris]|uniref:Uncharacterized protein n=1 Tax=Zizania palustris TaxID=103762 RepID=A0A8J6BQI3_ZIZPA|nr:hypothetical protein GUJ93_ZPchr0012g21296 [Zizania palustris]